jgi:hypothetical protein
MFTKYYFSNQIRDEMVKSVECMGDKTNQYKTLVGKPKRKRSLGRLWHRWRDSNVDLKEIGYEDPV